MHFTQKYSGQKESLQKLKNYISEYFCDLFAAKYVGNSSVYYLSYHEIDTGCVTALTHPFSVNRNKLVGDFLADKDNKLLKLFKEYSIKFTKNELKLRYERLSDMNFYGFIPLHIQN